MSGFGSASSVSLCVTGLATLLLAACGPVPPKVEAAPPVATAMQTSEPAVPDPDAGRAKTPYTKDEIRAATPEGRSLTFVLESPDKPPVQKCFRFMVVDDERATIVTELLDQNGKTIGTPENASSTWEELRTHASYPLEATTIEEATAETPAGSFPAWRYIVVEKTDEGTKRTVAYFAKKLPGPPVDLTVEMNGQLLMTMTLIHFSAIEPDAQ